MLVPINRVAWLTLKAGFQLFKTFSLILPSPSEGSAEHEVLSLIRMMLSTALVLAESSMESFINSATSVECTEQTEPERGRSESRERRRGLTSLTLGMGSRAREEWLPELRMESNAAVLFVHSRHTAHCWTLLKFHNKLMTVTSQESLPLGRCVLFCQWRSLKMESQ